MGHSKRMLEGELQEVIALTSQQLEEQREKVLELEDEVGGRRAAPCAGRYCWPGARPPPCVSGAVGRLPGSLSTRPAGAAHARAAAGPAVPAASLVWQTRHPAQRGSTL